MLGVCNFLCWYNSLNTLITAGGSGGAGIGCMKSDRSQSGEGCQGYDFANVFGEQFGMLASHHQVVCVINHNMLFPGEDVLVDVVDEVIDLAPKWKSLGLALRLKTAELDAISSKNHTDPTECLKDMLLTWLQQRYDTKKYGLPSWRMLCQAISKPAGGNNPALARKIAGCHQVHTPTSTVP